MFILGIVAKTYEFIAVGAYYLAMAAFCILVVIGILYGLCHFKELSSEGAKDIREGWPFYLILFIFGVVGPTIYALYDKLK